MHGETFAAREIPAQIRLNDFFGWNDGTTSLRRSNKKIKKLHWHDISQIRMTPSVQLRETSVTPYNPVFLAVQTIE